MARITVVIPTFNRSGYLARSMESVLSQDFTDFVLLVSDNASSDDTPELVRSYDDPRIQYVRRPENIGWLRNYNASLACVETEYAQVLNDDDLLLPGALGRAVRALDSAPRAGMLHTAHEMIDANGGVTARNVSWAGLDRDTVEPGAEFIRRSMERFGCTCPTTVVVRTEALPPVPFDPIDAPHSDHPLGLNIALSWDVLYLATPSIAWREHPDQDSTADGIVSPGGVYARRVEVILRMRDVKRRFIEVNAEQLGGTRRWRRPLRRYVDRELVERIRAQLDRGRRAVVVELIRGMRASPTLVVRSETWRVLARALVGPRVVSWWRGRRPAAIRGIG